MAVFKSSLAIVILYFCAQTLAQLRPDARWCTVTDAEYRKCEDLRTAIYKRERVENALYPDGKKGYPDLPALSCIRAQDEFACMEKISDNEADLIQLDPGMGYTAGEYFTMMPLMAERYETGAGQTGLEMKAVAVVRKANRGITINNLDGKKACHTSVGHAAGWVFPIAQLIQDDLMPIVECNVPAKSAANFFGDMCAPNGLARFYNPFGNNPVSICKNCKGPHKTYCTGQDPYAGYSGAFSCMSSGDGDVAFVRESTIFEATSNVTGGLSLNDFELLCTDGRRASPSEAGTCNWGKIPSHIIMTSAIHDEGLRQDYKDLMWLISHDFGVNGEHKDIFEVFKSTIYGERNLLFTDETKELMDVSLVEKGARDTYYTWVGEEYRRRLKVLNTCPLQQARWCVISSWEMTKCENMIMAFTAKGLKPDLNCILGVNTRDCMSKINTGDADMMALDAADVFVAGRSYGLVPIASEDYSGYDARTYYAVAVARRTDSHLTLFNLKDRRSCHSAVWTAAGWVVPVDKLIETGQIYVKDCNVYHKVGQFFSKSCIPGILSKDYNTKNTNPVNLCEACASGGPDRCMRTNEELYYGNSGAFRCLTEMGGDVAFVKHTAVRENTDNRNNAEWARNRRSDDYELLCNDGTRTNIDGWKECNMGEIPANAIVAPDFKSEQERNIYWTLLNFAQQFFASDSNPDFPMFDSMLDHKDLIFQDSTVRLIAVEKENQNYKDYLGPRFLRAMERLENIDCITSSPAPPLQSLTTVIITMVIVAMAIL